MSILSLSDFPPSDDPKAIESAIALAESLAEGISGANRSLSIEQYTEVMALRSLIILPSYFPLVSVEKISYRGAIGGAYQMTSLSTNWEEIPSAKYSVDYNAHEIVLDSSLGINRTRKRGSRLEIKLEYSAGFDFSSASSSVLAIKSRLTELAIAVTATTTGIKSFEIDDGGHKTTYFSAKESPLISSESANKQSALLSYFQKFQPRSYRFG
jgi:hypothetical protein